MLTIVIEYCNSTLIGKVIWISWSIMSTALNLFLLLVFGVQLIRAILTRLEMVGGTLASGTYPAADEDRSLTRQSFHFWNYEEGRECLDILLLIVWTKVTKVVIAWKSNIRRSTVERPRSTWLFGLCALHFSVICGISISCASLSACKNCLNVIGL